MFTLKLLLKRSCWTFIFMALALPVSARVCFLPDSTDCGEGGVDVPEVQITCATYGGYETEAACLEARTNKTAQTCTLNSGCYYPKCAYDSERNCKNDNPDKKCLSQDVDGVKCWYSQPKTCSEQGYQKTPCTTDEDSGTVPNTLEASDYGPNDTCPQYTDRKDAGVTGKDGVCSTCEPQACTTINTAYKNEAKKDTCGSNKEAKKVDGTDSAADGPCYTCVDKGDGSYDYIIYIDDTQSQENDKVTISRSVYSTDRNATFDAESAADVTEERCDWNCNCDEGGTSISLANGQTATYWNVNMEAGGGSSGECDYTRTDVSWNYTKVTVNGTTKEYKNTQCKDGTITDSKGTVYKIVCGIPTCSDIAGYQTTPCSTGYKQIDYIQLPHEDCYKCEKSKVTITIALDATNTTVSFSTSASDSKGYTVKLSLNGGGNDGITYPVTVTEGRTATYFSSTYEPGDCDVHGDNCDNDLGNGRETVSAASNLSVIINDQTVLRNLTTENEYLDMRYFIGKTYDTDNYIIKFVKAQTCSDLGYQTTPCSTGYKQIDYIQLPHEDCYKCEIKQAITITVTDNINPLNSYSCNYYTADPLRCSKYRFTRDVSYGANSTVIGNKGKLKVSYDRFDPYDGDVSFEVNTQNSFSTSFDFDCERSITAMGNYCLNLQEFNIRIEGVLNTYETRKTCEEKTLEIHGKTFNIKCEGNASLYYNNYK